MIMNNKNPNNQSIIPAEIIEQRILLIRSQKIMLDADLAELYQVPTFRLNEAVKRNIKRFPEDFMFQLTAEETKSLISQIAISKREGRGGRRHAAYAFTEQGVAMLSSVLNSDRAIAVNIAIMRSFVRLRQILTSNKELAARLLAMEKKYDGKFKIVFDVLRQLMEPPPDPPKEPIGFSMPKK
jgi:hypothetical protein